MERHSIPPHGTVGNNPTLQETGTAQAELEAIDAHSERTLRRLAMGISMAVVVGAALGCGDGDQRTAHEQGVPTTRAVATRPTAPVTQVSAPVEAELQQPATYEAGEKAFQDRDYREATRIFEEFVGGRPDHGWGHYMLGLSQWKAGQPENAVLSFERVLELDGDHTKSLVNLGRVLLELERPAEARELALRAYDVDPTYVAALRTIARAEDEMGNDSAAVERYLAALRLNPSDVWSMNNLGLIHIREGRFEEAIGPLARATELSGDEAVFHNNLGAALEGAGFGRSALAEFDRTVELDPNYRKAMSSVERLSAVRGLTDLRTLDLVAYAAAFEDELLEDEVTTDGEEDVMGASEGRAPVPVDLNAVIDPFGGSDVR